MKKYPKLLQAGVLIGAVLTAAPVLGLGGTVFGMMRSFSLLQGPGINDPKALSYSISVTLLSSAAGLSLFPLGVIILTLSLILQAQVRRQTPPPLPPLDV